MDNIKIFENPQFGEIRTMTQDGEPWFVGKDVAELLGYVKPQNAIAAHVDAKKTFINLSAIITRSNTTAAQTGGCLYIFESFKKI